MGRSSWDGEKPVTHAGFPLSCSRHGLDAIAPAPLRVRKKIAIWVFHCPAPTATIRGLSFSNPFSGKIHLRDLPSGKKLPRLAPPRLQLGKYLPQLVQGQRYCIRLRWPVRQAQQLWGVARVSKLRAIYAFPPRCLAIAHVTPSKASGWRLHGGFCKDLSVQYNASQFIAHAAGLRPCRKTCGGWSGGTYSGFGSKPACLKPRLLNGWALIAPMSAASSSAGGTPQS